MSMSSDFYAQEDRRYLAEDVAKYKAEAEQWKQRAERAERALQEIAECTDCTTCKVVIKEVIDAIPKQS